MRDENKQIKILNNKIFFTVSLPERYISVARIFFSDRGGGGGGGGGGCSPPSPPAPYADAISSCCIVLTTNQRYGQNLAVTSTNVREFVSGPILEVAVRENV